MSVTLSDLLIIGDVYIINTPVDNKIDDKPYNQGQPPTTPNIPRITKDLTNYKQQLKADISHVVQPGSIKRPSAGELLAKDEPPIKKEADAAIRDTLDQIPELQKAKEYLAQQRKR